MGHVQCHSLKDYWSRDEQYYTPFYSNVMTRDSFFHILRFLHFENNGDPTNHDDPDYDRLWKIRIFDTLNNKFCELYNPTEHLAVDGDHVVQRKSSLSAIYSKETKDLASKFTNFATLWSTLMI